MENIGKSFYADQAWNLLVLPSAYKMGIFLLYRVMLTCAILKLHQIFFSIFPLPYTMPTEHFFLKNEAEHCGHPDHISLGTATLRSLP